MSAIETKRGLLGAFLGLSAALAVEAREPARPSLFDAFLSVDALIVDASQVAAARAAFESLALEASRCGTGATPRRDRARCVVDALFASGELQTIAEPGNPGSLTVTAALVDRRGNCAGLTGLALAVAERAGVPMEAVVFPRHVVVRAPGDGDHVFELLRRGDRMSMMELRTQLGSDGAHDTRVRSKVFPAYYLDNFAVTLADAGEAARAEAFFEDAVEAAPREARIRLDYGTFLLGQNRVTLARDQLGRAVDLDSRSSPAWTNLGVALARLGAGADARRCFERALRYDPGNTIAAKNLITLRGNGRVPSR
jgi:regulator of sirC expression with transglutaminase-like and TPR domain